MKQQIGLLVYELKEKILKASEQAIHLQKRVL